MAFETYGCENCKHRENCDPNPFGICKHYAVEGRENENQDDYNETRSKGAQGYDI